jgi:hypothetical protein
MYSLIHSYPLRTVLTEHAPTLGMAFVIAEVFYKFHSFTLECLAFLGTWYLLDGFLQVILSRRRKQKKPNGAK